MTPPRPKQATEADQDVGSRIATLRTACGLSQTTLAQAIGVSFQQVQKYESGRNRVGAGRLQAIADRLGVPVSRFFGPVDPAGEGDDAALGLLRVAGTLDLLRAFAAIPDADARRDVLVLVRTAARLAQHRHGGSGIKADETRRAGQAPPV